MRVTRDRSKKGEDYRSKAEGEQRARSEAGREEGRYKQGPRRKEAAWMKDKGRWMRRWRKRGIGARFEEARRRMTMMTRPSFGRHRPNLSRYLAMAAVANAFTISHVYHNFLQRCSGTPPCQNYLRSVCRANSNCIQNVWAKTAVVKLTLGNPDVGLMRSLSFLEERKNSKRYQENIWSSSLSFCFLSLGPNDSESIGGNEVDN